MARTVGDDSGITVVAVLDHEETELLDVDGVRGALRCREACGVSGTRYGDATTGGCIAFDELGPLAAATLRVDAFIGGFCTDLVRLTCWTRSIVGAVWNLLVVFEVSRPPAFCRFGKDADDEG